MMPMTSVGRNDREVETFEGTTLEDIKNLFMLWPGAYAKLPSGHANIWSWTFYLDWKYKCPGCHDGVDAYAWIDGEWHELDAVGCVPSDD